MAVKYNYWRRHPPRKDWADGEGFDLRNADFGGHYYPGRSGRGVAKFAAATYFWLCGEPLPRMLGGQAWPASGGTGLNLPGADGEEGYSVADTGEGEPAERGETLSERLAAVLRELGLSEACAGLRLGQRIELASDEVGLEPSAGASAAERVDQLCAEVGLPAQQAVGVRAWGGGEGHPWDNVHWPRL